MQTNSSLPYACQIVDSYGDIESCTNADSVAECVLWFKENGISMEQVEALPRVDHCIFRYMRKPVYRQKLHAPMGVIEISECPSCLADVRDCTCKL